MPGKQHVPTATKTPPSIAYGTALQQQKAKQKHPAGAGTTYQACHYMCSGRAGTDLQAQLADGILHVDLASHDDTVFVLRDGQWDPAGELHVDVDCYIEGEDVSLGRFRLAKGFLGDIEGPWVWNYGAGQDGRGVGVDPHGGKAKEVTVSFLLDAPSGLPPAPPRSGKCPPIPGFEDVSYLTLTVA